MRVVLAGATGTAGRATLTALLEAGHSVVALHRGQAPHFVDHPSLTWRKADVTDPNSLARYGFKGEAFDALVTTLTSRTGASADAWRIDSQANSELLRQAVDAGVNQAVFLSAICVQKPRLAFQFAKIDFEERLIASGLTYSIVRPTAFFKSLSGQIERVRSGKPFLLFGDGQLTRCKPISDRDLGRYIAACLTDTDKQNKILPIGGPGPAISPVDQARELFRLIGRPVQVRKVPLQVFSAIEAGLRVAGTISSRAKAKAELAQIGRYYATESMLLWDEERGRYDAEATPAFGDDTLFEYYADVIGSGAVVDLGDHAVF